MGTAYTVIVRAKLPRHLVARAVVMRDDGTELTADDVAKARALYAPVAKKAKSRKTPKPGKAVAPKPSAKSSTAPRRKAAKRPKR